MPETGENSGGKSLLEGSLRREREGEILRESLADPCTEGVRSRKGDGPSKSRTMGGVGGGLGPQKNYRIKNVRKNLTLH